MNPEFNPRKTARDGRELRRILSNPEYSETGLPYRPLSQYDEAVKPRSAPSTSCPTAASWTASSPQFTPRNTGVPYINDRFYGRAGRSGSGGNNSKPQSKSCCFCCCSACSPASVCGRHHQHQTFAHCAISILDKPCLTGHVSGLRTDWSGFATIKEEIDHEHYVRPGRESFPAKLSQTH